MEVQDLSDVLGAVRACWPSWRSDNVSDDVLVRTWFSLLADITRDEALSAVQRLAIESAYVPGPGHLRRAALDLRAENEGAAPMGLDEAYAALTAAVGRYGYVAEDEAMAALPPVVAATVRGLGGWGEVCMSTNPEALRAHFAKAYTAASLRVERSRDPIRAPRTPHPAIVAAAEALELGE